jgi:pimeloyl-ACP methyl ester carboxylesterase
LKELSNDKALAYKLEIMSATLIAEGEEYVAKIPEKAKRIHKALKGSKLSIIPKAGHGSGLVQPDQVNKILGHFIRKKNMPENRIILETNQTSPHG